MNKRTQMNTKRTLVSLFVIASVLLLASAVSAADIASNVVVKVNDVQVASGVPPITPTSNKISVNGGDTLNVEVQFTAINGGTYPTGIPFDTDTSLNSTSNVKVRAELEGQNIDVIATTASFDVIGGETYIKDLSFQIPADLSTDLTDNSLTLSLKISNSDYDTEISNIPLILQRNSYDASIKSVLVDSTVAAGQVFPVDVVLKNTGFNDLTDMYVTVSIPELNIQQSAYFGDLVALKNENCDSNSCDTNTVSGRLYINLPYSVQAGSYTLQVKASNDQTSQTVTQPLTVTNGVSSLAIQTGTNILTLLNPTSQLQVYTVKYLDQQVTVVMPATSSKDVTLQIPSGQYKFDATVYSGTTLLSTVTFSGTSSGTTTTLVTSPVMVLTIILAVVFLVLLVVLIVLITRKPQKAEEFGESYY